MGTNLYYNRGDLSDEGLNISAPLDDTFIHLQYGRQIGEGQWFSYNDGDPVSSGASSFLYVLLLGAAHFVGFSGANLLGFAIIFGTVLFVLSALLGYGLGQRLAGERAGLCSGILIAANGAFGWGATSGMEVALFSVLILGTLLAFLRELSSGRFLLTPILAALAALTRPEGLLFAWVITGAVVFVLLRDLRKSRPYSLRSSLAVLYAFLPIAAGVAQYMFYTIATGSSIQNGVLAKSLLYEPVFYPTEVLDAVFQNLTKLSLIVLTGLEPGNYLFPGTILFCVLGTMYLALEDARYRMFAVASGTALVLAMSSTAILGLPGAWGWHHYRYLLPFFPPVLVFAVVGFYSLRSLTRKTWLPEALASFAILCSLLGLPVWAATTGGNSLQIKEQQVSVGYWIRENLPPGTSVGVNDAGAMRYYGGHRTVDLIGLTTNDLALPTRNGVGSLYETLEKMPEEKRPDYFAIYPTWFPGFEASGVLDQEIARFAISDRPEVAGIVGGSEVVVFRADWSLAQSGEAFQGEGSVKDTLDIADLGSETEHDYEMHMPLIGLEPANFLTRERSPDGEMVVDGGRGLPGAEEFTIRGLSRNRPVEVVMRTTSAPFALQVQADGRYVGEWDFQPSGSRWQQATFTIPAESVRSGSLRVRLSPPEDAPLETHTAYYYWFVQRI
ncbi:MAG TPA: hypothetical protein VFQ10_14340 [Rubrobacter sp.]|nr:hypothetical protein [Rubrobacter sp.]